MSALVAALALLLSVGLAFAQEPAPRMGGVLKIAMIGEPLSLDLHTTTATITQHIMLNVYEGLFTYDKGVQPIPMLAESYTATDGGRRYTIALRTGVKFHNGKEMVAKQQLEEAGFKVDLQVVDWATLVQRRNKPEPYDVFSTGLVFNAFPPQASGLQCNWPGWWCLEEKDELLADMAAEPDARKRKAMLDRVQVLFYDDVGRVKFGDYFSLDVARKDVRGDFRSSLATYFYSAWLAR